MCKNLKTDSLHHCVWCNNVMAETGWVPFGTTADMNYHLLENKGSCFRTLVPSINIDRNIRVTTFIPVNKNLCALAIWGTCKRILTKPWTSSKILELLLVYMTKHLKFICSVLVSCHSLDRQIQLSQNIRRVEILRFHACKNVFYSFKLKTEHNTDHADIQLACWFSNVNDKKCNLFFKSTTANFKYFKVYTDLALPLFVLTI